MSKKYDGKSDQKATETKPERRVVEKHRQCPRCYEGALNGVGQVYSTQGRTQYRKCDQCGHTWTTLVKEDVTVIRNRTVEVQERTAS